MAALYDSGDLDHVAAKDYMACTAKIGELASRYIRASVLAYDQEYRRRQAAARFRWGSGSQHLCTVLLKEKAATPTGIKPRGGQTGRRVGPGGKKVCIQYNHGKCSYGPRCNFEHVGLLAHPHSDCIAFRHLPPNSARFGYATEGALFISAAVHPRGQRPK